MQGTYTVRLIVANYCGSSDTVQTTINVCAQLSGGFTFGVTGNTVTFTSAAINAAGAVWNFGDGGQSTATNPVHTYAVSGPYTVTMKAYNICGDTVTASQVVITCSIPTAEWVASVLSSNGAGMRVQFEAGPWCSPDVVGYQWLYGDGTQGFGANPIKTYAVPGLFYNVTLIASNDCGGKDTLTKSLRTVDLDEASVSALCTRIQRPQASGFRARATVMWRCIPSLASVWRGRSGWNPGVCWCRFPKTAPPGYTSCGRADRRCG